MRVDAALVDAAMAQARASFPEGEGGAAAVYLDDGSVLTSIYFESPNDGANLCHETGAYCEANRLGKRVVASVCVSRESAAAPFVILTPCGICQERLATWGLAVEVGVAHVADPTRWQSVPLAQVQPWYWRKPFMDDANV